MLHILTLAGGFFLLRLRIGGDGGGGSVEIVGRGGTEDVCEEVDFCNRGVHEGTSVTLGGARDRRAAWLRIGDWAEKRFPDLA